MKNFILLLLYLFFLHFYSRAQKTSVGVQGGINYSTITTEKNTSLDGYYEYNLAYKIGVNIECKLNNWIGIRAEINKDRKGAKNSSSVVNHLGPGNYGKENSYFYFDYYSVPLFFQLLFGKKIQGIVQIGTSFNYLAVQTFIYDIRTNKFNYHVERDKTKDFERFDQSVLLGLAFSLPVNERISIRVMARSSYGIKNLNKINSIQSGTHHLSHSALLGLQYHFLPD